MDKKEIAVFGGGCFWCTEAVFKMIKGVSQVLPGYAGGTTANPTYEQVSSGNTGHAEVIYIEYDSSIVNYNDLLTIFFASHDGTTLNSQGNDVGTQYRSVIFYTTDEQKEKANNFINEINSSYKEGKDLVTEVAPLDKFYKAESYHEDYYANNKNAPYCQVIINPKLEKVEKQFASLLEDIYKKNNMKKLTPEQYKVMKEKGTEAPFSGKYVHKTKDGDYRCAECGNLLFSSQSRFDSGTGWPSFDEAYSGAVKQIPDKSYGMDRIEVVCSKCESHLGHVFDDGPTETGKRYCMNSVCLDLEEKK